MKAVGAFGTIKYGSSLILTILLIILFGVGPAALGAQMFSEGTIQGILLIAAGLFITYAGTLGLLYKVIADAVATGNKKAPFKDFSQIENTLESIEEKIEASEQEEKDSEDEKEE